MFYKKINLLILLAFITSCTLKYEQQEQEPNKVHTSYGIWQLDRCKLYADRADIQVALTDIYTEDKARVLIKADQNLAKAPEIKIWGFEDYDFEVLGQGNTFSLEVPVTTLDQARMYLNQTFLQVRYMLDGTDYYRQAIFSLKGFPEAIVQIKRTCK